MKKSKNEKVQKFLEDMMISSDQHYNILQKLREIVFRIYPKVEERIMYGGIMFTLEHDFGGIYPSKNHVSFEFSNGFKLKDPKKLLEGTGKFRRHLKFKTLEDVEDKEVDFFVKQVDSIAL